MASVAVFVLLLMWPQMAAAQFERDTEHRRRVDLVRRQLESSDPKEVAWGAFTAASDHLEDARGDLALALEGVPSDGEPMVVTALLDAIVQTRANVPASTLAAHLDRFPVQTLLAFRDATGEADSILLERLAAWNGDRWHAAANLLLEHRARGFAAALLSTLRFRLSIHVITPPPDSREVAAGIVTPQISPGVMVGDGIGMNTSGFPPTVEYRFAFQWPDALVLSTGPVAVFYSRHVHDEYQFATAFPTRSGPTPDQQLQYLQWLARAQVGVPAWTSIGDVTVTWRSADDYRQQVAAAEERLRFIYSSWLDALMTGGALSPVERAARDHPPVDVDVDDRRTRRDVALPSRQPR